MRTAFLVLVAVCFIASVYSNTEPLVRVAHYEPVVDFQVNPNRDALSFRAYGKLWVFSLWVSDVSAENNDHFQGRLDGEPSSLASFTLLQNYITGMIILHNETFWLEARDSARPLELSIYKTSDVWFHPSVSTLQCSHAGGQHAHAEVSENAFDKRGTKKVAVYMDQYWTSSSANPSWYTNDRTRGLLNDVNAVYAASGLTGFEFTVMGSRRNSWTTQGQLNSMLTDISNWNRNTLSDYNMVAWLVGHNVGGLAWVGSGCGRYGNYYRTSVSGLANWSRLWTVKTIAHELGHNRGASHDFDAQCRENQNTNCQCSVMSYCFPSAGTAGGAVNYFSERSKKEILSTCN